ncbi:tRNA(Met) cytidine acetyltransferase TmcA [Thiorhodovibrio frisius]|uniref:tRNA(Met) cytidine acetyltransferase TmcA n=1 Tax=Thiorhodovibrio frisius TaxID=631362 RepID=H8YX13_9GAMM|nr:GNAT family N-acetyltransferase [Thiorhodovibrio frisius]EIC22989.1 putative P-loop ATPase fused to an acetyltransferase [Thiorhodovibrio frisius]WPL22744.1 tRNA(Met) cytidine acetyltransferase TmcA [Thiorhodovibrio frisius]
MKVPTPDKTINTALALRQQARVYHQRRLLLLEGEADWTLATAQNIVAALTADQRSQWPVHWLGRHPSGQGQLITAAQRLLGSESELIIYDLFAGLDADALAAAAGALRGGGLLLLLGPPLDQWSKFPDPAAARIATHPYRPEDVGHGFLTRMAALLEDAPGSRRIAQLPTTGSDNASEQARGHSPCTDERIRRVGISSITPEQQQVIAAIRALMTATDPRPLVISAGRGRGKSTALGLAAAALCDTEQTRVLVTAPRYRAARTLLEQAGAGEKHQQDPPCPHFLPPDQICRDQPATDLLLVDEAAGIPAPLLRELVVRYPRIVFATTTQGYEGTGRGFALRFLPLLDQSRPGWRHLILKQPVRFAASDPLEALIDRLLLLDAEPATDDQIKASSNQPLRAELIERTELSRQEERLRQLFGLLMLAHYQTRPNDLRHLLDGPNLSLTILRRGDTLLATALVAKEGAFDDALSAAIFAGERRPRGHLLPQTLSAHAGLMGAPRLQYARIVRIAVHPAAERQGHGRALLHQMIDQASADGCDLIGASFGATPELLAFWHACDFIPVQLGSHRNAATGAHAAVVLRALSPPGQELLAQARAQFTDRLPRLLPGRLRELDPALVVELLRAGSADQPDCAQKARLPAQIKAELHSFAHHQRSLEAALPALAQLAPHPLARALAQCRLGVNHRASFSEVADTISLSQPQAECFIAAALQQHPPEQIAPRCGQSGRAAVIKQLRQITATLLDAL